MRRAGRWFSVVAAVTGILLAAVNNVFVGYEVLTIGVDRVIQALLFLLLLPAFFRDIRADSLLRLFCGVTAVLVLLRVTSALVGLGAGEDIEGVAILRGCSETVSFLVLLYLCYFAIHRYPTSVVLYLGVHMLIWIFAALQHPLTPLTNEALTWKMRYFDVNLQGSYIDAMDAVLADPNGTYSRVSGPYESCIALSYALVSSLGMAVYAFVKSGRSRYLFVFGLGAGTAVLTLTRSIIGAVAVFGLFLAIHALRYQRGLVRFLPAAAILAAAIFTASLLESNPLMARVATYEDASAQGKFPLVVAGSLALISNPLHVSVADYREAQMASFDMFREGEVLIYGPHNGLLNVGFTYTVFGILLLAWYVRKCWRTSRVLGRPMRVCFGVILLAYLLQASFHNNFLFLSDRHVLVPLAAFLAEVRRARDREAEEEEPIPAKPHVGTPAPCNA